MCLLFHRTYFLDCSLVIGYGDEIGGPAGQCIQTCLRNNESCYGFQMWGQLVKEQTCITEGVRIYDRKYELRRVELL